jgi:hypothetical protein
MIKRIAAGVVVVISAFGLMSCERVTDAEVGVKTTWSGTIEDQALEQDVYFPITYDIRKFSTRNLILDVSDTPIVENVPMDGMQIRVNYSIKPELAPEMWKREKGQHLVRSGGEGDDEKETFLMGGYVTLIAKNAMTDVVKGYKALEVNEKRSEIEPKIKAKIIQTAKAEGRDKYININSVNIMFAKPPAAVVQSAKRYLTSLNDLKTKQNEVQIAKEESDRLKALSSQADAQTVQYLKAQAEATRADAFKVMAENGSVSKVLIVPENFTSLGNSQ